MWALPEDRQTARIVVVRVEIPVVEVELAVVALAVERIRSGLPPFFAFSLPTNLFCPILDTKKTQVVPTF